MQTLNAPMSEPSQDAAGPRDPRVLASHVTPPSFEFEAVVGRAEVVLLQASPWPKLVTLCAAPGYGKSVLMSRLHGALAQRGHRCLWVTLDDRDTDLDSLLFTVRAALTKSLADDVAALPARPDALYLQGAAVDRLFADLSRLDGTTVLFIDNLGYCLDGQLAAWLERLVFASAPGLRLVLSSTREIPVDTVRAKLELGAVELRAPQLVLDRAGIARLMHDAGVDAPSEALLERIQHQTEGWPTGVRLLQLLLSQDAEAPASPQAVEGVVGQFSGDQRDIARWLTRRVLTGFEPEFVRFMAEVALVRECSAELAAHMTGRAEAGEWLQRLVARNVLIFPLDSRRRWLRFHTLLREFLLAEGRELLTPARRHEVLERAARWHAAQGNRVTALDIALDGHAVELAQALLTQVASVVAGDQGRMTPYIQWVDRLQAQGGAISLEAQCWYVWALCNTMQYERARNGLQALDARLAAEAPPGAALRSQLTFLGAVVNIYLDRLPEAREDALRALDELGDRDAMSSAVAAGIAAFADIREGLLAKAHERTALAEVTMARTRSDWGRCWVAIIWALLHRAEADPVKADQRLVAMRKEAAQSLGEDAHVVATIDFVHARVLLDLGRVEQARGLAGRGFGAAFHHGIASSAEVGLSACAALWDGNEQEAFAPAALDRLANCYSPRVRTAAAASRVRRLLQLGRVQEAHLLAQRHQLTSMPHERAYGDTLMAPLELQAALGAGEAVQATLERHLVLAQAQGRQRDRVELLLLSADLLLRRQQPGRAAAQLALAVAAAAPGRLLAPFLVRGAAVAQLLRTQRSKDLGLVLPVEQAFIDRLGVCLPELADPAEPTPAAGVEMPSPREIELLALLDQGLANQQLADRLGLSLATVKWHLRNLYAKLGVGSRSAALAKARAMNLLRR